MGKAASMLNDTLGWSWVWDLVGREDLWLAEVRGEVNPQPGAVQRQIGDYESHLCHATFQ